MLNSGPPELPLLIEASVWKKSSYDPFSVRPLAETIPAVTEKPCPSGLPIAITQAPTRIASLSPSVTNGNGLAAATFSSAISVALSIPTTLAFSEVPSMNWISMSSAPSITWLLVTI
ncbi:hypothetical protein GALL_473200 [mine drainage metagenome]|uniref:Uncharacterized protein n=1 Tax=mine drainage metagenome TaxID=410659 RepID=A0A1J5PJS5_9ZZZZ